jgi:DNA-binding NarL/FixJ family response regulator
VAAAPQSVRINGPLETPHQCTIVLAEELALLREGMAAICALHDRYRVVAQCADGEAAFQSIQTLTPDVAILDLNLPHLFTLEIARRVRQLNLPTKLIFLSVRGDRKTVLECLRGGASGFLLKSAPSQELLDALDQVLAGGVYVSQRLEVDRILIERGQDAPEDSFEKLSPREFQVFSLMVEGVRAKEIAARLNLSPKTVDTYRANMMRKLDIFDLPGLVKFALQRDLTSRA